ncbi:MAG TPA: hypothetical protein PLB62_04950, partial [Candidatus Sumerlaeota bacterium]|nr:hypothetical protein [Candidatus Sumerlaeota bacterium]
APTGSEFEINNDLPLNIYDPTYMSLIDDVISIDDLISSGTKRIEKIDMARYLFVKIFGDYDDICKCLKILKELNDNQLYNIFYGSILGTPNTEHIIDKMLIGQFIYNYSLSDEKWELYDNSMFVFAMRRSVISKDILTDTNKLFIGISSLKKHILFNSVKLAISEKPYVDDFQSINISNEKIQIIKSIFDKGIPVLEEKSEGNIIYDNELNGSWIYDNNKWSFRNEKLNDHNGVINYNFKFSKKGGRCFVGVTVVKGNMTWDSFIYRVDRVNENYSVTGFWFIAKG